MVTRVPFPFPPAALAFLGAFIPIVGASVSGVVAVLVALVDKGSVISLIRLGSVIFAQQLEVRRVVPRIRPIA